MRAFKKILTGSSFILISCSTAMAARGGIVTVEGAELYQFPDKTSVVLIKLHKGTRLAASNVATLGFHRVRLWSTLVGWVAAQSIVLQPALTQMQAPDQGKAASTLPSVDSLPPPTHELSPPSPSDPAGALPNPSSNAESDLPPPSP